MDPMFLNHCVNVREFLFLGTTFIILMKFNNENIDG